MRRVVLIAGVVSLLLAVGAGGFAAYHLTDDRLRDAIADLLNQHFSGKFGLDRAHYAFPGSVEIHNLTVQTPEGETVMTLGEVRASLRMRSLFVGQVVIDDLTVAQLQVDLHVPPGGGKPPLLMALNPEFKLPALQDIHTPVRIGVTHVNIEELNILVRGARGMRARLNHVQIADTEAWLFQDMMGASLTITGAGWLHDDGETLRVPNLRVHLQDMRMRFSSLEGWVEQLQVEVPGVVAEVHGYAQADNAGLARALVQGHLHVDSENPILRPQLPDMLRDGLRGATDWQFAGNLTGQDGQAQIQLHESRFEIRAMPIREFNLEARKHGNRVDLVQLKLGLAQGWLRGSGNATLTFASNHDLRIGPHELNFQAHALPIRALVGQFVSPAELLPQQLSFAVRAYGRSLWPPTGAVDVDTVVEGLPGEDWPGLPRALEVRGRFLTHPDLLEVLRMGVAIDKLPNFAIQGALPMRTESAATLLEALHSPAPLKGLNRIPVAPSDQRPTHAPPP